MTGKQSAVLWLGLLLIVLRLFTTSQWSELWDVFGQNRSQSQSAGEAPGGSLNNNNVQVTSTVNTSSPYGTTPLL